MILKIDIINDAYSQLRISGITVQPSPSDLELALSRLESLAAELRSRNLDAGYLFEETPDPNSPSGIPLEYKHAFSLYLALNLIPDFNKQVPQAFAMRVSAAMENLAAREGNTRPNLYPSRMPLGSGNDRRYNRLWNYYTGDDRAPNSDTTNKMYVGDVNDYSEDFSAFMDDGETISTFTIQAGDGLTLGASSNDDYTVSYRVTAESVKSSVKVIIVITTSNTRVKTREIFFSTSEASV